MIDVFVCICVLSSGLGFLVFVCLKLLYFVVFVDWFCLGCCGSGFAGIGVCGFCLVVLDLVVCLFVLTSEWFGLGTWWFGLVILVGDCF